MCRRWRNIGEDPSLWAKFKFVLWLPFRDFYFLPYRPLFPRCQKALEKRQQDVLSLRRLQYVKDIRLSIRHGYGWAKVAHHLQIIRNHPSKLKKLSLSQFDEEEHSGALLQARERFELVNVKNQVESENDIDYEEDYEELRQMLINRLREEGL